MLFRARQFEFRFPRPAPVMGIVNVTPDSFSDGGKFFDAEAAVAHALKLVADGAEILDIGGESTRPGATPVGEEEELRRVIPVIKKLSAQVNVPISIDTTKPTVARVALDAGASIVNDVGAATHLDDFTMWKIVVENHAGYILMHAQGSPPTMQEKPTYRDVVREVSGFFSERLGLMMNEVGLPMEQLILDPGIGFGKTPEHNLALLTGLKTLARWRRPLLIGVSRKSFMGKLLGVETENRLPASLACAILAVGDGAQIIRTHDVAETVQAIRMAEIIFARKKNVE
ncbi:MAG: dihydropteroate synthase [Verrucomicrobiae bacterium]